MMRCCRCWDVGSLRCYSSHGFSISLIYYPLCPFFQKIPIIYLKMISNNVSLHLIIHFKYFMQKIQIWLIISVCNIRYTVQLNAVAYFEPKWNAQYQTFLSSYANTPIIWNKRKYFLCDQMNILISLFRHFYKSKAKNLL